jgi:hypothetical protein
MMLMISRSDRQKDADADAIQRNDLQERGASLDLGCEVKQDEKTNKD